MLRPFRVLDPTTVAEASSELGRLGDSARIYAGGAELVLLLRHGIVEADHLVNVKRIPDLDALSWEDGVVRIGATTVHHRLESDALVRERLPLFAYAESHVGNVRVRNQGTVGGNLCFADPHADVATALLVYDATVRVANASATREMPLGEFLVGTYATALEPDELLTEIRVPPLPPGWGHAYQRIEQFYRPTLNVAAAVGRQDGRLQRVRLAVGCIGPKAVRLSELEERLQGLTLAEAQQVVAAAREYLADQLEPVDDLLGSAEYKLHLAGVLLGRSLAQAAESNGGTQHG